MYKPLSMPVLGIAGPAYNRLNASLAGRALHLKMVRADGIGHWSVGNTMSADWCKSVVEEAIEIHGKPDIFNADQGSQFASEVFTSLLRSHEIQISMDGIPLPGNAGLKRTFPS